MLGNPYHLSWQCDFHASTEEYAKRFSSKAGEMIFERQDELLSKLLGDVYGKNMLDVGGGHGQTANLILRSGGKLTAYGSGENNFFQLKKVIKEENLQDYPLKFKVGRLDKLGFKNRDFDVVISLRLISHVPDWTIFLKELCRVAKRSVIIDFAPATMHFLNPISYTFKNKVETASREFTTQHIYEIEKIGRSCGFRLRDYHRQFVIPLVIHRLVGNKTLLPVEKIMRKIGISRFMGGPVIAVMDRVV